MTLPAYPSVPYFPVPGSWSIVPAVPPLQTDMGGGNLRRRQQPGSNVKIVSQKVQMTAANWSTLSTFNDSTLSYGTSRFTMSVWTGAAYVSKTVQWMDDYPHLSAITADFIEIDMKLCVYAV